MEIYMRNIAFAATEDDLTIEFAKILHKPPFPNSTLLNFEVEIFRKSNPKGKQGILALPTEGAGRTLLNAYGVAGIVVKGRKILITQSNRGPMDPARINKLNTISWRDPTVLRKERERLVGQSTPFQLLRYSFGRFGRDGSFSSEVSLPGVAQVSCNLERRQVHFTLETERERHSDNPVFDLFALFGNMSLGGPESSVVAASYSPLTITTLVGNQNEDTTTLFIRADAPPAFSADDNARSDYNRAQRLWGLSREYPMPPGCHSLMLVFHSQSDADTFKHACCSRLHLHYSAKPYIQIHNNISISQPVEELHEFLLQVPYELGFEVEKAVADFVLSPMEILLLKEAIVALQTNHGPHAPEIFRSFVSEHKGHRPNRRNKRRRQWQPNQDSLTHLLDQAIQGHIQERQKPRRLLAPAPQSGVCLSYHLVLTPTRYILEGPLSDQSNSVLRRYGHHECFLRVTFQEENGAKLRRDFDSSITELLKRRYRPVLLKGYRVAGRRFEFLGYSMSGLKEHSVWFMTPFHDENGLLVNADSIRKNLGDFTKLEHFPARLAARWSQAFSGTDPSMTLLPREVDFHYPDIESPSKKVMTDGCSPISVELAKDIWRALQGGKRRPAKLRNVPSAFQFRLGGAKGMVVQDPTIPGKIVRFRPSQIKFDAKENLSFDVQSTSARPKAMYLNRPLIVLMEFLGVDTHRIIELQDDAIKRAQSVRSSSIDASKVIQQHGMGASYHLPSLFSNLSNLLHLDVGYTEESSPEESPKWASGLIDSVLHCAETHILRELKYRAHIEVPDSYTLLGVSDEWDCLEEGEIFATVFDERKGIHEPITGKVAITRSPQIHPGDMRIVTAVRRPELEHLRNVVVFSCRGQRALASCLGGGDLDGDDFNLILDPDLLPKRQYEPGEYKSLPIKETEHKCGIDDVVDFVFDYIEADLVGQIATQHLRFSDLDDPNCQDCLKLALYASQAVDFPKTGTPVNFNDLPKLRRGTARPDFLAKEGADLKNKEQYYNSKKLLGALFRRVPVKNWEPEEWNEEYSPSDGETVKEALSHVHLHNLGLSGLPNLTPELTEEMTHLLDAYGEQLLAIGETHTILKKKHSYVSEAELVSGTIMANWSDHRRRREAVTAMNLQTHELVYAVRAELQAKDLEQSEIGAYDEDDDDYEDWTFHEEFDDIELQGMAETFKRCWAAWCVAEDALEEDPKLFGAQSFGLIALGRMLEIVKASYHM